MTPAVTPAMAAILLAASGASPGATVPGEAPIGLVAREADGGVRLSVVGLARQAYSARYSLEVIAQGPGGTNRTTQSGSTTLRPGERTTLLSVALGGGGAARWHAILTVTPAEGAPYRRQIASPPAPPGTGPS